MKETGAAKTVGVSNPETTSGPGLEAELRRRFSFTRCEANIALLLADGLAYVEIAERLCISYHTVHTHVKAIHTKARVRSNGRLQALLRRIEGDLRRAT